MLPVLKQLAVDRREWRSELGPSDVTGTESTPLTWPMPKEFVQEYFESHRDRFGAKLRDGSRKLRGSDWEGLMRIRDLRRDVFG